MRDIVFNINLLFINTVFNTFYQSDLFPFNILSAVTFKFDMKCHEHTLIQNLFNPRTVSLILYCNLFASQQRRRDTVLNLS